MQGLSIHFTHPWLLLLLIPAAVLTVLPYFLLSKRYRRTRNRIVSMVMHGIALTLAVFALSGISFSYTVHNDENEILLLVDVSDTEKECAARRDAFVEQVVDESAYDGYRIGIVTFGFDQRYTVPLTSNAAGVMEDYYAAKDLPDTSATDIAAALRYAATLFRHPESAKIVLITDGQQTDEDARTIVRAIAAQGVRVDTVNIAQASEADLLRVTNVVFPDYHVGLNEEFNLQIELFSAVADDTATVEIYDNGAKTGETDEQLIDLIEGTQIVSFRKSFAEQGVHEIVVRAAVNGDDLEDNNTYCSYFNVEVFTEVLILEQADQSAELRSVLDSADIDYNVEVINVKEETEKVPSTIDDLCKYDQIILNNIANKDLPEGFDVLLYNYVYSSGGGLFTTGGMKDNAANAYNRRDLANTLYQQLLPVQAIDYTQPVGVEFIIDVSGSMTGDSLEKAKIGAINSLNALTERDYVGVTTLSSTYGTILQPTRRTQELVIKEAIDSVTVGGNTVYSGAIRRAGDALKALRSANKIDRGHMIIMSDGLANGETDTAYLELARRYREEDGITISVVGINMNEAGYNAMATLVSPEYGNGNLYQLGEGELDQIGIILQQELKADPIEESDMVQFHPVITDPLSNLAAGLTHEDIQEEDDSGSVVTRWRLAATLEGFYGTRARAAANIVMTGQYGVPIYAQWKFGRGTVGSFMCDVYGEWSADFLADANGRRFLQNAVANLMPIESIHPQEIKLNLREENYINQLGVSVSLEEGDRLEARLVPLNEDGSESGEAISLLQAEEEARDDVYVTAYLSAANRYSRCTFVLKTPGLYRIEVMRYNAADELTAEASVYKTLSYSDEYDKWTDTDGAEDGTKLLADLAENGRGQVIEEIDPWSIFDGFNPEIVKKYDPRILFMVIAMIAFLLDIIVRKFKFKWPHELIREYKQKKAERK